MSFRLTSFVLVFFWVWVRKSEQGLMLCTPVVDMKQTCGSNRPTWQLSECGCAVILECECQMRWREKGDHYTAHPTWQPASLRLHGRTEGGNSHMHVQIESAVSRFTFFFFFNSFLHPGLVWGITHDAKFQFIIKRIFSTLAVSLYLSSNTGHRQTVVLW